MTDDTYLIRKLPGGKSGAAALTVALAILALLGATGAVTAQAQSEQPTIHVSGATTAPADTTTVDVILTAAPDGLSGYSLSLAIEDGEVARIESASYPDRFGLTADPAIGSKDRSVTLEAADVQGAIEPGSTNVTLATVHVVGGATGAADVTVEPRQFDGDDGTEFQPLTQPGLVMVQDATTDAIRGDAGDETGDGSSDSVSDDASDFDGSETPASALADSGANANAGGLSAVLLGAIVLVALAAVTAVGLRRRL